MRGPAQRAQAVASVIHDAMVSKSIGRGGRSLQIMARGLREKSEVRLGLVGQDERVSTLAFHYKTTYICVSKISSTFQELNECRCLVLLTNSGIGLLPEKYFGHAFLETFFLKE